MRIIKARVHTLLLFTFFLFSVTTNAQYSGKLLLPALNLVPAGISKTSFEAYSGKSEKLKIEMLKLIDEKKALNQKCKDLETDTPSEKQCQKDLAQLTIKVNELIPKINTFNSELEEIVFKDPSLDKISMLTYFSLKKDAKAWDEFQQNVAAAKTKLEQDKIRIQQELTKLSSKKQQTKVPFTEGVILSMFNEEALSAADNLKSPFTGESYKETATADNSSGKGTVIVSFGISQQESEIMEKAGKGSAYSSTENFSLASARSKGEFDKLKDKKFNRLIAHSNGATVAECLLKNSAIEVKELNIIGGDKSLLNGAALQQLLDKGTVKRIVVWINLDDPNVWITTPDKGKIIDRTEKFISYKNAHEWDDNKTGAAKVEYKWILGNSSLAALNEKDPQFIETYFREISKEFKSK
ncbi:MAG: hypothetical protein V4608_11985 [Bacteroidota bacterium]